MPLSWLCHLVKYFWVLAKFAFAPVILGYGVGYAKMQKTQYEAVSRECQTKQVVIKFYLKRGVGQSEAWNQMSNNEIAAP